MPAIAEGKPGHAPHVCIGSVHTAPLSTLNLRIAEVKTLPTELVEKVKESRWMKDGEMVTTFYVTLVDGTGEREVPCYSPLGKDLKEDAPLPDGWEVKTSKAGKLYLAAPKQLGSGGKRGASEFGKSSWYNSEEGVRFTQERTDRRTALMQAVREGAYGDALFFEADAYYSWLRKNLDVSAPRVEEGRSGGAAYVHPSAAGPKVAPQGRVGADTPLGGGGELKPGEAPSPPSSKSHAEKWSPSDTCPICGEAWGPKTTSSGKRLCVRGHVERFDYG